MNKHSRKNDWPKIRKRKTKVKGHEYTYFLVDCGIVDGHRVTKNFKPTKDGKLPPEAERWAEQKRRERSRLGLDAVRLSDEQKRDAVKALNILGGNATLEEAALCFQRHASRTGDSHRICEVVQEYLDEARRDNLRQASIDDLQYRLGRFQEAFGKMIISEVKKQAVRDWLRKLTKRKGGQLSATSRRHYQTVVGGLFNYAIEQGYTSENPFAKLSRRRPRNGGLQDERLPEIITVSEVEKIMEQAQSHLPEILPALAIGFFAGLRTTEIRQLDWKHVRFPSRGDPNAVITVPPEIAKRRSVRHVDMQENLFLWLKIHNTDLGPVVPADMGEWGYCFEKVRKLAGIKRWPRNGMRHCFATYHLAMFQNQNLTALQLGHRDTDLLYNHYRALATHEDAKRFWSIKPAGEEGKVVGFPQQAS